MRGMFQIRPMRTSFWAYSTAPIPVRQARMAQTTSPTAETTTPIARCVRGLRVSIRISTRTWPSRSNIHGAARKVIQTREYSDRSKAQGEAQSNRFRVTTS